MNLDEQVRQHVMKLLKGGSAHLDFESAVDGIPQAMRGATSGSTGHTPWRLIEHMRIAQWDILQFSLDAGHVSPSFPDGYWPSDDAPADDAAWHHCLDAFRNDLHAMQELVANPTIDLFAPIPHGDGQTILREALLVADHNAYHLGQLVLLRRVLGIWHNRD